MASISEIAKQHNLTASAIRYYESQGLVNIPRDHAGNRLFDSQAEDRIRLLSYLHQAGLSLVEMQAYIDHMADQDFEIKILQASHQRLTDKIAQLNRTMHFLDYKISYYQGLSHTNE